MGHGMWVPRMTLLEMLGSGEKSSLLESLTGCVTSGKSQNPSGLTDVHSGSGERNWTPPAKAHSAGLTAGPHCASASVVMTRGRVCPPPTSYTVNNAGASHGGGGSGWEREMEPCSRRRWSQLEMGWVRNGREGK